MLRQCCCVCAFFVLFIIKGLTFFILILNYEARKPMKPSQII